MPLLNREKTMKWTMREYIGRPLMKTFRLRVSSMITPNQRVCQNRHILNCFSLFVSLHHESKRSVRPRRCVRYARR